MTTETGTLTITQQQPPNRTTHHTPFKHHHTAQPSHHMACHVIATTCTVFTACVMLCHALTWIREQGGFFGLSCFVSRRSPRCVCGCLCVCVRVCLCMM